MMKQPIAKIPPRKYLHQVDGRRKSPKLIAGMALMALVLTACDRDDPTEPKTGPAAPPTASDQDDSSEYPVASESLESPSEPYSPAGITAISVIEATAGSSVSGELNFVQEAVGVRISGALTGLTPGQHGFHVHEFDDCSAPDASSAGDHFAPHSKTHGSPDDHTGEHHAGDLGNILADEQGRANVDVISPKMSLLDGPQSIIGRSVIVHSQPDDLVSQPSGNSGEPVGCGTIEKIELELTGDPNA